jgi:predicted dehydrogenase
MLPLGQRGLLVAGLRCIVLVQSISVELEDGGAKGRSVTIGVGIIGAGTVTQTVHLPTLARMPELFEVRHVMDVDQAAADRVAARTGARSTSDTEALLSDRAVDVVAVCSPPALHARHVIDACLASKPVVLCEKPLATSVAEADAIVAAATKAGAVLVVGTMHLYDPGWLAAADVLDDIGPEIRLLRSSIMLPPSDRYEAWATEYRQPPRRQVPRTETAEQRASVLTQRLLGVAIHDMPLMRRFLPQWRTVEVTAAALSGGRNYAVTLRSGDCVASLVGSERVFWRPEWEFEAFGEAVRVLIEFTPSFVHAGSAVIRLQRQGETRAWGPFGSNGYEQEWRHVADCFADPDSHPTDFTALLGDLSFAISVAEQSSSLLQNGA